MLTPFVDTVFGFGDTVMKEFTVTCRNCNGKTVVTVPVEVWVKNVPEYAKAMMKKQRTYIEQLENELYQLKEKPTTSPVKHNTKIYSVVIEALIARGMKKGEAENTVSLLVKR